MKIDNDLELISTGFTGLGENFDDTNPMVATSGDYLLWQWKNGAIGISALAASDPSALAQDLIALGMETPSVNGQLVSGFLPTASIASLTSLNTLQFAHPALKPISSIGLITTGGDVAQHSQLVRGFNGLTGRDVKVGVLSGSYDNGGAGSAAADIASGDLPGAGNPNSFTTPVTVLRDNVIDTDEGRAMLQIVHDVAPGAHQRRLHINCSGKHFALRYAIGLAVVIFGASMRAAQVTFAFEAMVTDVSERRGGADLLPFPPTAGQHMSGIVTFTPVPFGDTSGDDAKLDVTWEGETFTALSYKLQTVNNYGGPLGAPIDGLGVVCDAPDNCATSSTGATIREFSLGLGSFQDVIPAGHLMDTVEAWNRFENRQLLVYLSDLTDTKSVSIFASVGPFQNIPEPASLFIVLALTSSFVLSYRPAPK